MSSNRESFDVDLWINYEILRGSAFCLRLLDGEVYLCLVDVADLLVQPLDDIFLESI